jgi:hypothetical protein
MTRSALFALVLAAACTPPPAAHVEIVMLGQSHVPAADKPKAPVIEPPDPQLPYRLSYASQGGMWMPQQMRLTELNDTFKRLGVKLPAAQLADPLASPMAAVVSLGNCSASFVSNQGLIVTNHHCAQGALQLTSDAEHNLVEDGFTAATLADEKPIGPSQRVLVAQAFTDVTKDVRDGLEEIGDPIARKDELDNRTKKLVTACEKDRPWVRCYVASFFAGGEYTLIEMLEIKDVRLVYAPARQVGDYGGETDNWEWPRHTGDWSFYRAYVGKDGKPAAPSPDNVPYQPKHWLQVTTAGMRCGDFAMALGYPGSTSRTQPASVVRWNIETMYPYQIGELTEEYKIDEAHLGDGGETAIRATTAKQGVENRLEKLQGVVAGFAKNPALMIRKDELDRRAKAWADQEGHEEYKAAIDKLEAFHVERRKTAKVDFERRNVFGGSRLISTVLGFGRWADERSKPDAARRPGYQERDLDRARAGQKQFAKQYDKVLDRARFRMHLVRALALPAAQRPWLGALLDAKRGAKVDEALIDKQLDAWYADTKLEDPETRMALLEHGTLKELAASTDPMVRAAMRIWPVDKAEQKLADARAGQLALLEPFYVEALRSALGGVLAPDANGTLRVSFGTVRSLHPDADDLAEGPFTVASQIPAKNTGKGEFNAPKKLLAAIAAKQWGPYADAALGGELPVNFEADLDTTNGSSGSPVVNAKGELVGLAFDGNKEGLASDAVFDATTTRAIVVDARYMIWTMDLLDGAQRLVSEMGLSPQFVSKPPAKKK